jgi:hypothetical protein
MPGWSSFAGSGPITWMLWNATSTAWKNHHQRKARQGEDDAAQTANVTVGVGIMIAHNPLHGSGRADFPHPALALGDDAHATQGIGMTDGRWRQPAGDEAPHAVPKDATVLTAPRQRTMPEPPHLESKDSRAHRSTGCVHICFDVLERLIAGEPIGRIVGPEAMKFGWQRLNAEYAKQFGMETPDWPSQKGRTN